MWLLWWCFYMTDEEWVQKVAYYAINDLDITIYPEWNEDKCKRLMPMFYYAWKNSQLYKELAKKMI